MASAADVTAAVSGPVPTAVAAATAGEADGAMSAWKRRAPSLGLARRERGHGFRGGEACMLAFFSFQPTATAPECTEITHRSGKGAARLAVTVAMARVSPPRETVAVAPSDENW
jgi:hypothetical protein